MNSKTKSENKRNLNPIVLQNHSNGPKWTPNRSKINTQS